MADNDDAPIPRLKHLEVFAPKQQPIMANESVKVNQMRLSPLESESFNKTTIALVVIIIITIIVIAWLFFKREKKNETVPKPVIQNQIFPQAHFEQPKPQPQPQSQPIKSVIIEPPQEKEEEEQEQEQQPPLSTIVNEYSINKNITIPQTTETTSVSTPNEIIEKL
jgi:type IV secretory pathway VirB10-like protein